MSEKDKRIVFTTGTPNDQGGIITDDVIDFSRFNKNPVVLKEHRWSDDPIGLWTDIRKESKGWSGLPIFHALTDESKKTKDLYEGGWIRGASIGGEAIWKTNAAGQYDLDKGFRKCVKFILYEISIVTLPSNEDAVQTDPVALSAKIYEAGELENINRSITTLSSKFYNNMAKENATTETATTSAASAASATTAAAAATTEPAAKPVEGEGRISLSANELPGFLEKIINGVKSVFTSEKNAAPTPQNTPESSKPGKEIAEPQPKPTGLSAAEKAKEKAEKAREAAEKAMQKAEAAKKKADAEDATDEMKAEYKTCMKEANEAMKAAEEAEAAYEAAKKKADDGDGDEGSKEKSTNSSSMKPQIKTMEELRAEQARLAAPPTDAAAHAAKVMRSASGRTFSQLASDKGEGRAILNRVMSHDAGEKNIADYAVVLNTILNDGKYAAFREKVRFMMNVNEAQLNSYKENPSARAGLSMAALSAMLNTGVIEAMGRDGVMRNITKLNSSDDALASPALTAIEWLPLAIFKLFPTTSWKNEIGIFAANETGNNLGVIWANIAANPTIYKGAQPVNPADYTYNDTAVSLKLTPYWLQPMRWTPLTMHQLRYDQMGTGWAQAFALWGATMDDDMLYTLASTVPAGSIVTTSGLSGNDVNAAIFNIASASDPNAFYYNPAFTGDLKKPVLNDIIVLEQIYKRQNFMLEAEKSVLVMDPTMDRYISQDPETKSLLTRWINADGAELLKFKNTVLHERSRVAIYDPATGQVKDPGGVIPATSVSAGVSFIPSQVGMGLGMLDVFMIQDPSAYGYRMSADIRLGIVPLRANFDGTALYTYAAGNV